MPPIFWIEDGVSIKVDSTVTLTKDQIIEVLTISGQMNVTATTQVAFLVNEYEGNENTPGIYAIAMRTRDVSGNENLHNVAITVIDTSEEDEIILTPDVKAPFYETYMWELIIGVSILLVLVIGLLVKKNKKTSKRKAKRYKK